MITREEAGDIALRSMTLHERVNYFTKSGSDDTGSLVDVDILDRWSEVLGGKDRLERRIEWDDVADCNASELLGKVNANSVDIPEWLSVVLTCTNELYQDYDDRYEYIFDLVPDGDYNRYEKVLAPFAYYIGCQVRDVLKSNGEYKVRLDNISALEAYALRRMLQVSKQTLDFEKCLYRSKKKSSVGDIIGSEQENKDDNPSSYVEWLIEGGISYIFKKYPFLSRLIGTIMIQSIDSFLEFLERLNNDWNKIDEVFNGKDGLYKVSNLELGLSDVHCNGRSTIKVKFENGLRVIYKPKNIGMEEKYVELVEWLNENGIPLSLKSHEVLSQGNYGWSEYIDNKACRSTEDVASYFVRFGELMCIVYVLDGTDFHMDNIVQHGAHPCLVDVETLFHPKIGDYKSESLPNAKTDAKQKLRQSVLRTLLLPQWSADQDGNIFDVSGGNMHIEYGNEDKKNSSIFKDNKTLEKSNTTGQYEKAKYSNYIDEIINGFQSMYELIKTKKDVILEKNGPIDQFSGSKSRFIRRSTQTYYRLLDRVNYPQFLRSGIRRSVEIDALSAALLSERSDVSGAPRIAEYEHRALERLDIPLYWSPCQSRSLHLNESETVQDFFSQSSLSSVKDNILSLCSSDLNFQKELIRASSHSKKALSGHSLKSEYRTESDLSIDHAKDNPLDDRMLLNVASDIGNRINESSIRSRNKGSAWIGMRPIPEKSRYQYGVVDNSLYGGNSGIATFLASLAYVLDEEKWYSLAKSAVKPVIRNIERHKTDYFNNISIGGFKGSTSHMYCLSYIGSILEEEKMKKHAVDIGLNIDKEKIRSDQNLDVISGTAGVILSLLNIYKNNPDSDILELAKVCGNHLSNSLKPCTEDHRTWFTLDDQPMTGFSHGAAGISYSLVKLFEVTREQRYIDAALEGISYEQSLFLPEQKNWPDLRDSTGKKKSNSLMNTWCHGATGIAISRISIDESFNIDGVEKDINNALKSVMNDGLTNVDHLCCGNMGRILTLMKAGRSFNNVDLKRVARKYTLKVLKRKRERNGHFKLHTNLPSSVNNPGFMQGISGIGYSLLKMTEKGKNLPSVLLLE